MTTKSMTQTNIALQTRVNLQIGQGVNLPIGQGGQFAIVLSMGPDMTDSSKQNVGQERPFGYYFESTLHSAQSRNVWPLLRRKLVGQNHVTVTLFTIDD